MLNQKFNEINHCHGCLGKDGNDCCRDVFIILNHTETHLFVNFNDYKEFDGQGGIFYTTNGCPYLDDREYCKIQDNKPLYCKFYPIFITGNIYVDDDCPLHELNSFRLTNKVKKKIMNLQNQFPIYKKDWFFSDVKKEFIRHS
ncbi:MAG: YkgJ family cysteine cluster protein [Candidatus Hodarchaeales archaeon]|jgi:Fe-S-cluster containining protein